MGRFGTNNGSKMGEKRVFPKVILDHSGCSNKWSLSASVMAANLFNCTSLTTLALSLRIAKNEDGLVTFMDDNTSNRLFKDVFCKGMHMLNLLQLDLFSGSITNSGACALANALCNAQTLTGMHLDLGYNNISPLGVASLFLLIGQYEKLQSFYLNVCVKQKWRPKMNWPNPFTSKNLQPLCVPFNWIAKTLVLLTIV